MDTEEERSCKRLGKETWTRTFTSKTKRPGSDGHTQQTYKIGPPDSVHFQSIMVSSWMSKSWEELLPSKDTAPAFKCYIWRSCKQALETNSRTEDEMNLSGKVRPGYKVMSSIPPLLKNKTKQANSRLGHCSRTGNQASIDIWSFLLRWKGNHTVKKVLKRVYNIFLHNPGRTKDDFLSASPQTL